MCDNTHVHQCRVLDLLHQVTVSRSPGRKLILRKVVTLEYVNLCDANRKPRGATHPTVSPLIIIPIFN